MKHILSLIAVGLGIIIFSFGCKKELDLSSGNTRNENFDSVIDYLKIKIPNDVQKLDFQSIKFLTYNNKTIAIQIFEKSSNKKFLLLKNNINKYDGNWVDLSNLSNFSNSKSKNSSGYIILQSINNTLKKKVIINYNQVVEINSAGEDSLNSLNISSRNGLVIANKVFLNNKDLKTALKLVELPEIIIIGKNEPSFYYNLSWLFEGDRGYNNYYVNPTDPGTSNIGGAGASSSKSSNLVSLALINSPDDPIKNLKEELKCFTINLLSSYSISVNVNQSNPDTRDKIDPESDFIVGHTFLTLEQINSDGTKIIRNVGYYPQGSVWPGNSEDQAIFGEDSKTNYAISLKISLSGEELQTVIKNLLIQQSFHYDLNNFNCVNSAALALKSIHVNLPLSKSGFQLLFSGNNPGDLGQDIRKLDLDTFSKENGDRVIYRTVSKSNNLIPAKKAGTCKNL